MKKIQTSYRLFHLLTVTLLVASLAIVARYPHEVYATCATSPTGSTLCAGPPPVSSNSTVRSQGSPYSDKEKSDVTITLGCATRDIGYGSYSNTCYQPTVLIVKLGSKVSWRNDDISLHSVTYGNPWLMHSIGYFFDSGTLEPGQTFTYQFNYLGAYPYFDNFNAWETGVVIVKK